ncbi:RDD family protein, partial [Candidatus Pseudothioglobus singularis]|uniref:RDD family protein n=1 Tax=Candidatus Pseudothioglobus singularis TaxID=1427364 RepID=UPI003D9C0B81
MWFWIKFQATPGKMATQLRLVDEKTGLSISTGQAVGRYFATILSMVIFGLGYLWIVFDRRNQSWHDKLAGTVVIEG